MESNPHCQLGKHLDGARREHSQERSCKRKATADDGDLPWLTTAKGTPGARRGLWLIAGCVVESFRSFTGTGFFVPKPCGCPDPCLEFLIDVLQDHAGIRANPAQCGPGVTQLVTQFPTRGV
jgi:hypothetical protein